MQITSCGKPLTIPDMYAGDYEQEIEIRDRWWRIEPGDVVLDIGASLGTYTLPALARGATVYAVDVLEQSPLIAMVEANGFADAAVFIKVAMGDAHGYPPELTAAVHANPVIYPGLADTAWTTVDRLAEECSLTRLDWIKIDTEGAEVPILRGAGETLARFHPTLLIEEHSHLPHIRAMDNANQLRGILGHHGYTHEVAVYKERELWFCTWAG
jgi:FkbM family methyltransferase